jgi:ribonuclease HI
METLDEFAITIYTDGSCYASPRVGGLGYLYATVDAKGNPVLHEECPPGWQAATNNQMELQACIEALELLLGRRSPLDPSSFDRIVIKTDSRYVVDNFPKAKFEWPRTGWRTRSGAPVANTQQWREFMRLVKKVRIRVDVKWVKGHRKDALNKRADKLAKESARTQVGRTLGPQRVRRKISPFETEIGSVGIEGQTVTIRIITDRWLPSPHRCYRYKYEVVDPDSQYFQRVDEIHSDVMLNAGHTYIVVLNADSRNPWIEGMIEEVLPTDDWS